LEWVELSGKFIKPVRPSTKPTVSVVVPCYNYGHFLPALIAGLFDQVDIALDIIIVDDASPDGSGDIAEQLASMHPRIRVIRHRQNTGHIQTYNDGLAYANGKYVVLLSADDYLPPGSVYRAVSVMEAIPDVGLVYGFSRSFAGDIPSVANNVRNWRVWEGMDWLRLVSKRGRCFIASPEVVMRTEALHQTNGYDLRLPHSADFKMWMETSLRWNVGRVNGPPQALYRVHDLNMHLTTFAGMITDLRERRRTFDLLVEDHSRTRSEVVGLRDLAMRSLALQSARLALQTHRDGCGNDVESYLTFAQETWPEIERSALWAACRTGPIAGRQFPLAKTRRLGSRAWHHALWRRWRRYGT
jgi:hypothetical protein